MKTLFLIITIATFSYSAYVTNTASGRFRDSLKVDSLRNSNAIGTDANGKFVKRDSVTHSHDADVSDSATVSKSTYKDRNARATSTDTTILGVSVSDSTIVRLSRSQLRTAVDSVRRADSANGTTRWGGMTRTFFDTGIVCDSPFIPVARNVGGVRSYTESVMRQRDGYIDIPSTDTTFTAFGATLDYYSGMATDTNGNVYAITNTFGRVYRRNGGSGTFVNIGVTARSFTSIYVQRSTNDIYASVATVDGWTRIYHFNGSDFLPYDSLYVGFNSSGSFITITSTNDMYFTAQDIVYKKTNMTGSFSAVGSSFGLNPRLTSVADTVYAFVFGGGVYRLTPGASAFSLYNSVNRYYQNAWVDDAENIYVGVSGGGPTTAGIYRKLRGLSTFDLLYSLDIYGFDGGTYHNGTLYACSNNSSNLGDIYTLSAANQFLQTKLNVGGVAFIRGQLNLPVTTGTPPLVVNSTTLNTNLNADLLDGKNPDSLDVDSARAAATAALADSLSVPGNGNIIYSNNGVADTSSVKYYQSERSTKFPGYVIQGDSLSYSLPAYYTRGGTIGDVDQDSSSAAIVSSPSTEPNRGAYGLFTGNESPWRGRFYIDAGDSGEGCFISPYSHKFYYRYLNQFNVDEPDLTIGRTNLYGENWQDSNSVSIIAGHNDSASLRIYGGKGPLSTTRSAIYMGNGFSNRMDVSTDSFVVGNVCASSVSTGRIEADSLFVDVVHSGKVDSAALADSTKKIPTILGGVHHHDDTIIVSIPTGSGYTKLGVFPQTENHSNIICDTANDQIVLTINGYYYCNARVTCYTGVAGVNIRPVLFLNEVEHDQTHDETGFSTANQKQRILCSGIIRVTNAPDTLTLRVRHDNGGSVSLNCTYGNMIAVFEGQ